MENIFDQKLLSFAEASKLTPGHPSISTFKRWSRKGLHGHRLKTWKVGFRRVTSEQALSNFFNAQTEMADSRSIIEFNTSFSKSHKQAEKKLEQMGV